MDSSRIIFVAPYNHTASNASRVIDAMGLKIPIVVGNDFDAARKVKAYKNCKVIIARGGSAKLLNGMGSWSVIDLTPSFYDIFSAITDLVHKGCRDIAVVSLDNIIGANEASVKIADSDISFHPCLNMSEIEEVTNRCIYEGCDGIVGCSVAVKIAKENEVRARFIDNDHESIHKAVLQAVDVIRTLDRTESMLLHMQNIVSNIDEAVIIFNKDKEPFFYNDLASSLFSSVKDKAWYSLLDDYILHYTGSRVIDLFNRKYLFKYVDPKDDLGSVIVTLYEITPLDKENSSYTLPSYSTGLYARTTFKDIVYASSIMNETVDLARSYAKSDATVLIYGQTGVGKEGFAQSIHNESMRSKKPFVSVNCASLPGSLIASELFGYADGAFTGARANGKKGLFEMAQGGTIFLDEITEIPPEVQSQFLRVIQEREVRRVGDDKIIPLNIRIICASNKDILTQCKEGLFRYDLYYRLNVLKINIPSLKDRDNDVVLLFKHFMRQFLNLAEDFEPSSEIINMLLNYSWPGNIRELRNVCEALSVADRSMGTDSLSRLLDVKTVQDDNVQDNDKYSLSITKDSSLKDVENIYLKDLIARHSIKEACRISGLSRTTLWRRVQQISHNN